MALHCLLENSNCFPVLHSKVVYLFSSSPVSGQHYQQLPGREREEKGEQVIPNTDFIHMLIEIRSWQERWFKLLLRGKFVSNKYPARIRGYCYR